MFAMMRRTAISDFPKILGLLTSSRWLTTICLGGAQMTSQHMGHCHDRSAIRPHLAAQHRA
jgi:hypothetical protein